MDVSTFFKKYLHWRGVDLPLMPPAPIDLAPLHREAIEIYRGALKGLSVRFEWNYRGSLKISKQNLAILKESLRNSLSPYNTGRHYSGHYRGAMIITRGTRFS